MRPKDFLAGFLIVLALAAMVPFASPLPDGLEKVASDLGFADRETGTCAIAPFPGYTITSVDDEKMSGAICAVLGSFGVFGAGWGIALLLNRRKKT